ncbi:MAG: DUF3810 domain-containing protein [Blautia sp.]|jgi:hypothetical protein
MKRICVAAGLGIFDLLLLFLAQHFQVVTQFYAGVIHPFLLGTFGRLFSWYPWSAGELVIYMTAVVCVVWLVRLTAKWIRKDPGRRTFLKNGIWNLILAAVIFFTLFAVAEGPNYYRPSFAEQYQVARREYTDEELLDAYEQLKRQADDLAPVVLRDADGRMQVSEDAGAEAVEAMKKLGIIYPSLGGYYPRPKPVMLSWALSLLDITGMYTPFTMEANYNRDVVDYNQPFTMCHELSHLKGYMQEQEANFIAYLACEQSESPEFQYSGALLGMIYCGNELAKRSPEIYHRVSREVSSLVREDLDANSRYWDTYDGLLATFSHKVNDVYLKVNQQAEGVKSYDRVVDYIVQHLNQK